MKRVLCLLVVVVGFCGCAGCHIPSERAIYDLACDALAEADGVPAAARPVPISEAGIGIAKNAASVDLGYTYTGEDGQMRKGEHVVWLKRVARTWVVVRVEPASRYR